MKKIYFKKNRVVFILLCFALLIGVINGFTNNTVSVFADSPALQLSYKIELENGNKFFYMRGSEHYGEDDEDFLDLESGLYYTESLENIYLVEPILYQGTYYPRYIYKSPVISEDGMYFANLPWTTARGFFRKAGIAIEFYKNGSLMKQYYLSDLTKNKIKFSYSVSHVEWENIGKRKFDATNNTLSVTTLNNKTIIFDFTTGNISRVELSVGEIIVIAISSILSVLVLAIGGLAIWKQRKRNICHKKEYEF